MKIVILSYKFPPQHLSGLEMGSDFMARELVKKGHNVHVIVTRRDAHQEFNISQYGYTLWRIPVLPIPLMRSLFEVFVASMLIVFIRPQQLHGQALIPCGLLSGFWGKLLNIPSLMYLYGRDVVHPHYFLRQILGSKAIKWNSMVLAATQHCKKNALKIFERDIPVYYSGFDMAINHDENKKHQKIKGRLLFVGRLEEVKGVDVLLKSLSRLDRDWQLHIIGEGSKKKELVDLSINLNCDKHIMWLGNKSNHDVLVEMREAEMLVLPSREEPYGIVLIEALAQGCRIVASDIGGIPEIINHPNRGLLVPCGDSDALLVAIKSSLSQGPLDEDLIKEIIDYYRWDSKINELESYYGR